MSILRLSGGLRRDNLAPMTFEPIVGTPVRFPPGRVEVRLNAGHRSAYRRLYAGYRTIIDGLPVLREDRDFDGRAVRMTQPQLEALNAALASVSAPEDDGSGAFDAQESGRTRLFKRLQYLS
jgi:hypothetical protein